MLRQSQQNGRSQSGVAGSDSDLPRLSSLASQTKCAHDKTALICRLLRQAATDNRGSKVRTFYSIRRAATRFQVPATTITRIYARLREEGLLTSIWGSKTFIAPEKLDRALQVRGVVGLPVSLKYFGMIPNYKMFFTCMQDVIWHLGFAARLMFYESHKIDDPDFVNLLINSKLDAVVWFKFGARIPNVTQRLRDRGIRVINIVDSGVNNEREKYCISRKKAFKEVFSAWRKDGIQSVAVLRQAHSAVLDRIEEAEQCLRETAMQYSLIDAPSSLRDLYRVFSSTRAVLFPSSEIVARLGYRDPGRLRQFLNGRSVLLLEGDFVLATGERLNATIDVIEVDWQSAARRIASDLLRSAGNTKSVTFEAKWLRCAR